MRIGTKSVLFGAHQFLIHPWFVAWSWKKLYGWPLDPRLWVAFFVHDLGYWGKPNMDGEEGETHPVFGAFVMHLLFGGAWADLVYYHSRFLAKKDKRPFSRLCVADKLAIAITPAWLYLPMARATGEIREYMKLAKNSDGKYATMNISTESQKAWFADVQAYLGAWVEQHKDGREDTWTPGVESAE